MGRKEWYDKLYMPIVPSHVTNGMSSPFCMEKWRQSQLTYKHQQAKGKKYTPVANSCSAIDNKRAMLQAHF